MAARSLFEINRALGSGTIKGKRKGITDESLVKDLLPKWCALVDSASTSTRVVLTITLLDLSCNAISDHGLRAIFYDFLLRYGIKVEKMMFFRNKISNLTPLCEYVFRLGHPHDTLWPASVAQQISTDGREDLPQMSANAVASLIANRDRHGPTDLGRSTPFAVKELHLSDNFLTVGIGGMTVGFVLIGVT